MVNIIVTYVIISNERRITETIQYIRITRRATNPEAFSYLMMYISKSCLSNNACPRV